MEHNLLNPKWRSLCKGAEPIWVVCYLLWVMAQGKRLEIGSFFLFLFCDISGNKSKWGGWRGGVASATPLFVYVIFCFLKFGHLISWTCTMFFVSSTCTSILQSDVNICHPSCSISDFTFQRPEPCVSPLGHPLWPEGLPPPGTSQAELKWFFLFLPVPLFTKWYVIPF